MSIIFMTWVQWGLLFTFFSVSKVKFSSVWETFLGWNGSFNINEWKRVVAYKKMEECEAFMYLLVDLEGKEVTLFIGMRCCLYKDQVFFYISSLIEQKV